jgi:hypothetical protein
MKRYQNLQLLAQILVPGILAIGSMIYVIHETYPQWTFTREFFIEVFVMTGIMGGMTWLGLWANKKEKEQKRLKKMRKRLSVSQSQMHSYKTPSPEQNQ